MAAKSTIKVKSLTSSVSSSKETKMAKAMKPHDKPTHPKTSLMVNTAIKELSDRGGSSLMAIHKYIAEKYHLDFEKKTAHYIKKYLKQAVADGTLVQTKGKGANGSFKMPSAAVLAAKRRIATAIDRPSKKEKSERTATANKVLISKKTPIKKQASTKIAAKTATDDFKPANKIPAKRPKAKKITKAPTSKPKAPRPRKVITASKSPKLAAELMST